MAQIKNLVGAFSNQNPFYFIENELEIIPPYSTNNIDIIINDHQATFIKQLTNNKTDKLLFLYERRTGSSTIMMAYCHWLCSQTPNTHIGVYTNNLHASKLLQTKVSLKDSSIVTINSGSIIHFNNESTINFISDANYSCGKQLDCLFVDNAPNFSLQQWNILQVCLNRHWYTNGKLIVISTGVSRMYTIPEGLQDSEFVTIIK